MNWRHIVQMHKEIKSVRVGDRGELYVNNDLICIYHRKAVAQEVAKKISYFIGVK